MRHASWLLGAALLLATSPAVVAFQPPGAAMIHARARLSTPLARVMRTRNTLVEPLAQRRAGLLVRTVASEPLAESSACRPPNVIGEDGQLPPQYNFNAVEQEMYKWWEAQGYFKPRGTPTATNKAYTIPMPPPNVTGRLHMGHAMFVALQDILARFHRMRGRPTLWLPGTDHAGIATQMLVERELVEEGTSRQELGREKFLERAWRYKEDKGGAIVEQMRRLGASADWSREKFTLEPGMSDSVSEAFNRLHEQGLLYRGTRLVNWSPNLQTAVSDLEVEFSDEEGKLYFFKYPLSEPGEDGSMEYLPVATTRPETILGDTAVCVHPEDPRYQKFIGKTVKVPMQDREIPVIADEYVDMEFGTGALKITPAHDPNDYEIGTKFNLPMINIMNKDASINEQGGEYAGLGRYECREKLWLDMEAAGLVLKVDPHEQRVPRSQRGGEIIEPMISTQWFVKMQGMADASLKAVESGDIMILPNRFEKMWWNWLTDIRDWCISRQLWWGHRIPVWYVKGTDLSVAEVEYFVARNEDAAYEQAREVHGADVELVRDEDVLDTWFSSGLWPFATVGWPHDVGPDSDFAKFYPATVLETGYDILFFWVARMVMMGINFTGQSPFEVIYMHGLVRDASGAKMSKTKGNVIDPLETIGSFGADALRYSLVTGVTPGQDIPLSMEKVEANRNFANKLWNAGRFLLTNLKDLDDEALQDLAVTAPLSMEDIDKLPLAERYIISRCHEVVGVVTEGLEAYSMADVGQQIYSFLWDEYADWFIEASKTRMGAFGMRADPEAKLRTQRVLVYVFDTCLRLLHPFMPYVTEALWQQLPRQGDALMIASWPQGPDSDPLPVDREAIAKFRTLQAIVRAVRNARAEYQAEPAKRVAANILATDPALLEALKSETAVMTLLGRIDESAIMFTADRDEAAGTTKAANYVVAEGVEVFLPLDALVDADKERKRLTKQLDKDEKDVAGLEKRLGSSGFLNKASPEVIEETKALLAEKQERLVAVRRSLEELGE